VIDFPEFAHVLLKDNETYEIIVQQMLMLRTKFDKADVNKSGHICFQEFQMMVVDEGLVDIPKSLKIENAKIWEQFQRADRSGDGEINFKEYVGIVAGVTNDLKMETHATASGFYEVYLLFGGYTGEVNHANLGAIWRLLGVEFDDGDLAQMFALLEESHGKLESPVIAALAGPPHTQQRDLPSPAGEPESTAAATASAGSRPGSSSQSSPYLSPRRRLPKRAKVSFAEFARLKPIITVYGHTTLDSTPY